MVERQKPDSSGPQPAFFTEAAPDIGVTSIDVSGIKPRFESTSGQVITPGNFGQKNILDKIQEAAKDKPWIKDILSGKKKAVMIVGAGTIAFIVGYEITQHGSHMKAIQKALKRRWKK